MKVAKILFRMSNLISHLSKQDVMNDEFHKGYIKCFNDILIIIEEVEKDRETKGISDPLTAQELARRITRDLVMELEDEELADIDSSFPALRSKIEFSRECYLKMINDDVADKRDYFDNYFRHYLIERLARNKSVEPVKGSNK